MLEEQTLTCRTQVEVTHLQKPDGFTLSPVSYILVCPTMRGLQSKDAVLPDAPSAAALLISFLVCRECAESQCSHAHDYQGTSFPHTQLWPGEKITAGAEHNRPQLGEGHSACSAHSQVLHAAPCCQRVSSLCVGTSVEELSKQHAHMNIP